MRNVRLQTASSLGAVVLGTFMLGQYSVSFSGTQWAWIGLAAAIVLLTVGGYRLVHAILTFGSGN
jgi:hypothetical protein